jgi:hypothetical protein
MSFLSPRDINNPNRWVDEFGQTVMACLNEMEGSEAGFAYRYSGPGEQQLDDHLFLFAPQPLEISGGADDGAIVCEPLTVDIDAVGQLFTQLESASYQAAKGPERYHRRHVALTGRVGERHITLFIFDEPFDDAEVRTVLETDTNSFRSKPDSTQT